jgi:hypothetical protein
LKDPKAKFYLVEIIEKGKYSKSVLAAAGAFSLMMIDNRIKKGFEETMIISFQSFVSYLEFNEILRDFKDIKIV